MKTVRINKVLEGIVNVGIPLLGAAGAVAALYGLYIPQVVHDYYTAKSGLCKDYWLFVSAADSFVKAHGIPLILDGVAGAAGYVFTRLGVESIREKISKRNKLK